jgi:hypothetical protein
VVAARGPHCERRQAPRDVSEGDQRYPAVGGGQPDLAAGAGTGQEPGEELAVDRCPGDRDQAPAPGEQPLGVPVADRVAERRAGVRVQAAQRDNVSNPASAGSADHVVMVDYDLRHRTVARDKHQRVNTAQYGAKNFRVGIVGGTRANPRRASPGRQHAPGQRDDLMRLLTGQKPHNLAADLPASARHRDTYHALPARVGQPELDGYIRPECPVRRPGGHQGAPHAIGTERRLRERLSNELGVAGHAWCGPARD